MKRKFPFPVIRVSSWDQYRDLVDGLQFRDWAFRGQSDTSWPLLSALSRHLRYAKIHRRAWPIQEARIMRIFRRKAHLFLEHVPDERDSFQWLALMQHHGAPTRLLDITWSPYVALFFAIERGLERAAVWTFSPTALNQSNPSLSTWEYGVFEKHFLPNTKPFVIYGEPKVMNQRLIAQSGSFMIPGVLDQPVEAILAGYKNAEACLTKLEINVARIREEAMRGLYSMNVTHATLFPDLDGLARSMAYELEYHWAFEPRTFMARPGHPPPGRYWFSKPDDHETL